MLLVEQVSVVEKISPESKERTKDAIALACNLSSTNCAIDGVGLHFHFKHQHKSEAESQDVGGSSSFQCLV